MSRPIKFRAWDTENEVYLEPDEAFLIADKGLPGRFSQRFGYTADENLVIEQYTGLKDKNGKEIYEGDIMRFDAIDYEIYWSSDFSGWHNRRTDKGERTYGSNSFEEVTRFGSVIGNIHENPELIGGEE